MLTANELPEDLLTQILLRLPVVSLLRFKCVCKFWYALITRQYFITKHLLHNNNNKNNSNTHLLLKMLHKTTGDCAVSTLSYETLQVSRKQHLPPPYPDKEDGIYVAGSCNGLVCLHDFDALHVVIWNPATNETKVVPKSNLPCIAPAGYRTRIGSIRFGFDAKTNDYKIIVLNLTDSPFIFGREKIVQTEVYSLSADSWRKVDGPPCFIYDIRPRKYINGMASWRPQGVDWEGVLSFDMSHKVFLKTLLPDDVIAKSDRCRHFFVLNELIAMEVSNRDVELSEICFDIWLLLEVGVKDSWTKHSTVGPFTDIRRLLGFWNNETMLLEKSNRQLVLYDPSTKEVTDFQIHGDRNMLQLVNYMETLVSVKEEMNLKSRTIVDNA